MPINLPELEFREYIEIQYRYCKMRGMEARQDADGYLVEYWKGKVSAFSDIKRHLNNTRNIDGPVP